MKLCWLLGITRQAYYQHLRRFEERSEESHLVVQQVQAIRKNHRRTGGRKRYEMLEPSMLDNQIKIGRDALFDLLAANHLLVKKSSHFNNIPAICRFERMRVMYIIAIVVLSLFSFA